MNTIQNPDKKTPTVVLPVSQDNEITRLINQAVCWESETELLFDQIQISPGWICADIGCGPMGILGPLSRRVGSHGQVVGVDSNLDHFQVASEYIDKNHLLNVKVYQGDFYNSAFQADTFNLTHTRFIYSQIGCDHLLLDTMIKLTKSGGVIVSQESDWTTWNCYPNNLSWQKIRNALIALFELDGGDINAGQRTYHMFKEANLADVQIRTIIKALPFGHPYRSGMNQMAVSLREKIINSKLLTNTEFDAALEACTQVINDPETLILSYVLCQVWGYVNKTQTK